MPEVSDCFELFGLTPDFAIDLADLARRYREQMARVHPDRFANTSQQQQREALEQAANLNEAYQVLRSSPRRAIHLLALRGHELPMEATVQDPEFLLAQLQWREDLDTLQANADLPGIAAFKKRLGEQQQGLEASFNDCWQDDSQQQTAERLMRRMQFLERLAQQVDRLEEQLDD